MRGLILKTRVCQTVTEKQRPRKLWLESPLATEYRESTLKRWAAHCSFGQATPDRTLVDQKLKIIKRQLEPALDSDPEYVLRFDGAKSYPLAENTYFYDLFNGTMGSRGICGRYGRFECGTSLPCHVHDYDESITIVEGKAICEVVGRRHSLSNFETAVIPAGLPHRFINDFNTPMAMIWVYAGDMPTRKLVEPSLCSFSEKEGERSYDSVVIRPEIMDIDQ